MVNKYNNAYHKTIKMKPVDVKSNTYIVSSKRINEKRIFLIKITLEIDLKKFLQLKDFKILILLTLKSDVDKLDIDKLKNVPNG